MDPRPIIETCRKYRDEFARAVSAADFAYEWKGIYNSELLLAHSITREEGVDLLVESGRARGQSTLILATSLGPHGVTLRSVELSKYTSDSVVAKRRLARLPSVDLHFGNAFELLPRLIDRPCVVLIDGPKGFLSVDLACRALSHPQVRVAFVHDVHRDSRIRPFFERYFSEGFYSDDEQYVEAFRDLDDACWEAQRRFRPDDPTRPYYRGPKRTSSYYATLAMFRNSERTREQAAACLRDLPARLQERRWSRRVTREAKQILKTVATAPYWFTRYHLS